MKDLEEVKRFLKGNKDKIKKEYKAEIIGIFGSFARREQRKESDLDILVKFEKGATLFDLVGLGNFLEKNLNIKVDIVTEKAIREELKDEILEDVVII